MTKVTYVPQDEGDALKTEWHGIVFPCNVPVEIDPAAGYEIEETKRLTAEDGSYKLVPHRRRVTLIEMARGNPSFQVEGEKPKPKRGRPPLNRIPNAAQEFAGSDIDTI